MMIELPAARPESLESVSHERRIPDRTARAIAFHLAWTMGISQGRELVILLGAGNERDNIEALTQWVIDQVDRLEIPPASSIDIAALADDLARKLERLLDSARPF